MFRLNPSHSHTALRVVEQDILNLLSQHFSARDIELYNQWHTEVPLKEIKAKFKLPLNRVEQIIKDIDQRLQEHLAPHRLGALLSLKPIYTESSETKSIVTQVDAALAGIAALHAETEHFNNRTNAADTKFGTPIETLNLPTRCYTILHSANVGTVEELCQLSRAEVFRRL